jgi:hypothetical protein
MPVFRLPEPVPVEALELSSDQVIWLGVPASERLVAEAHLAGLRSGEGEDVVTLSPGAVANAAALRAFVRASSAIPGDVVGRLAGPVGAFQERASFGASPRMIRLRGGGAVDEARVARASVIEVSTRFREFPVGLADVSGRREELLPVGEAVLVDAGHWASLLWANLLGLGPWLWAQLVGGPWVAPIRLSWALLRSRSLDPMIVAGSLNRVGRGAKIHPSAVVEGAFIGAGASIGPGAVVRGAVLGAGASVESQAEVSFSVLGPDALVQRKAMLRFGVVHPGATVGGSTQLGVLGPGAALKHLAALLDQNFGAPVSVIRDGRRVEAPLGMIGVGLGARSVLGAGVYVAPGRTVPPDLVVAPPSSAVVRKIPPGLRGAVGIVDGELRAR